MNESLFYIVVVAALGGLLFGFDTGVISGCEQAIQNEFALSGLWHGLVISGGEPLAQTAFLRQLIPLLKRGGVRLAIETSGYADARTYQSVISQMDFVYQDLKHHDAEAWGCRTPPKTFVKFI